MPVMMDIFLYGSLPEIIDWL